MDTNRIVKIEELEIGDEIIIPAGGGKLIYARVVRKPQLSKAIYRWYVGITRWKAVKCSVRVQKNTVVWGDKSQYSSEEILHHPDDNSPLIEKTINLNFKHIWLVKREEI